MESVATEEFNDHDIASAFLDAGGKDIVIMCHGFRSSSVGPHRFFVETSRELAAHGISSFRFDQFGSGNSEGDFVDSSFDDWVATTEAVVESYLADGFRVALLGQSMGGATVLKVGSETDSLTAITAWVPDPNIEPYDGPEDEPFEEQGEIVQPKFWIEAHDARVAESLRTITVPTYIIQCSDDEYVSPENHQAIIDNALPEQRVEMYEGFTHSTWTYEQASLIIGKTVAFFVESFGV